jgi:hypothetical protein
MLINVNSIILVLYEDIILLRKSVPLNVRFVSLGGKKDRNSRQKLLSFNLLTVSSFDKGLKNAHGE